MLSAKGQKQRPARNPYTQASGCLISPTQIHVFKAYLSEQSTGKAESCSTNIPGIDFFFFFFFARGRTGKCQKGSLNSTQAKQSPRSSLHKDAGWQIQDAFEPSQRICPHQQGNHLFHEWPEAFIAGAKEEREAGLELTLVTPQSCYLTTQTKNMYHLVLKQTGTPGWEVIAEGPVRGSTA